ncbi:MAG: histidine phosphatase family protein [Christensenellaceae bacterium]|jgi:broad specificity phosphatase PhoE|nr:histidine phosphatase family protein [Christensenellaceae bacterium]
MIYFVRHGSTDWNDLKKVQGRADISLNAKGIAQARALAPLIDNLQIDQVYCSPLKRAKETLQYIYSGPVFTYYDERLSERNYGEFEGVKTTDFDYASFWNEKGPQDFKTAENFFDFKRRVFDFLDYLKTEPNKNCLVISNQGVGRLFQSYFYGAPPDGMYNTAIPHCEIIKFNFSAMPDNAGKIVYDYSDIMKQEPELLKIQDLSGDSKEKEKTKGEKRKHFFIETNNEVKKKREGESGIDKMFRGFFDTFDLLFGIIGLETSKSSSFSSGLKKGKKSEQEHER